MSVWRFLRRSYAAPALLVAVLGLVVSGLAAWQVGQVSAARDREQFSHAVAQAQDAIESRLETYIAVLRAGAGMVAAEQGAVDRASFHRFVVQLRIPEHYPGVQGIGYSVRLAARDARAAQRELAALGDPDLSVFPSGSREEIHAILHLEPLDRRNRAALGFDMYSEPTRRAAMARARDAGVPAASGRVELVQEIDRNKQAGFLIYAPVYRTGETPATVADRRAALAGFVYSPFRADDLFRGIFGSTTAPRLNLEIYDGDPAAPSLLHRSPGPRRLHPRYSTTRALDVAGRRWTVAYSTRPAFERSSSRDFVTVVLLGGLFATSVVTAAMWAQGRARYRADLAAERSRADARELEILQQASARLAAELDRDKLVRAVTEAGRELTGAEIGAFFYNVTDRSGESLQLFTLSGAERAAFANMGMPRNTPVFGPTFRGEGPVRSADITKDPRYGQNAPHAGLPKGHWPVRSYLAVAVVSRSGEVAGGLFFGHSQPDVFTDAAERSIVALAGHAAIAIDNASLLEAAQQEIEARKLVEEQQKLLLDELNHRVKNTLATVQSISAQTFRSALTPEAYHEAFESRLVALSEAHNLLSRANWRGVMLKDLVWRELLPHGVADDGRIGISGPDLWLPPAAAVTIGMTIHELATNAARHGALSSETGRVDVSWTVSSTESDPGLTLVWQESGGPAVEPPTRQGFGTRMIERGVRHDLRGRAELHYDPAGLRCVITAPLPRLAEAA
jgi:CHASE1-domain containing sensor protein/two-component sensor histidine kinase